MNHKIPSIFTFIGAILATFTLISLSSPQVFAKSTQSNTSLYTVNWLGPQNQVVKTWRGPKDQAEKIAQAARISSAKVAQQYHPITSHGKVSPWINRVYSCALPNDFFDLYSSVLVCFANAGSIDISVDNVSEISSGNNHGTFSGLECNSTQCNYFDNTYIGWDTIDVPASGYSWLKISNVNIWPA